MNEKKNLFTVIGQSLYTLLAFASRILTVVLLIQSFYIIVRNLIEPKTRKTTLVFLGVICAFSWLSQPGPGAKLPPIFDIFGYSNTQFADAPLPAADADTEPTVTTRWLAGAGIVGLLGFLAALCYAAKHRTAKRSSQPSQPQGHPLPADTIVVHDRGTEMFIELDESRRILREKMDTVTLPGRIRQAKFITKMTIWGVIAWLLLMAFIRIVG